MNFVVIGTDHRVQSGEPGLEGLLGGWLAKRLIEPFQAVAEEYGDKIGESIGQQLALGRQPNSTEVTSWQLPNQLWLGKRSRFPRGFLHQLR